MKKIATILLFVFAFSLAGSVISIFFSDHSYAFVVDEEKSDVKTETQKKYTKDFITYIHMNEDFTHITNTAFQLAEKIQLPPCLEKLTPPPNLC
ncbi:MAG: hypothetical protein JST81_15960 [Bacteroidetes bacterium]|jgi:hypothetical protein|nr:hypothetical protein [Bacteroidota bacterium]